MNFLLKNLAIILFLFTIIFVVIVLILGSRIPSGPIPLQQTPQPTPTSQQITRQVIVSTNIRGQIFQVIDPLIINLSEPVATPSTSVRTYPQTQFLVKQLSPTSIAIEPEGVWEFDKKYQITITILGQEFTFSFQTEVHRGI